jgi:thioester reductase-like protein
VTGFIGKVWLANTLMDLPDIGRIYLLIRRQKSNPAQKRFQNLVEESPVFDPLYEKYGAKFFDLIRDKVQVIEGDVTQPGLALEAGVRQSLEANLDLIINRSSYERGRRRLCSGIYPFLPSCRTAPPFDLLCCWSARWPGI